MDRTTLLDQLLTEERRLRSLAEAEVRAYRKSLTKLALRLAPAAFDARRREEPTCFERYTPAQWEAFFGNVELCRQKPIGGWREESGQTSAFRGQRTEERNQITAVSHQPIPVSHQVSAVRQQQAVSHSSDANRQRPTANDLQTSAFSRQPEGEKSAVARSQPPPANRQLPVANSQPPADGRPPKADTCPLPPSPPSRYVSLFTHWEREGLALQILATTGWSLRYAVDEALAQVVGIGSGSGSLKRLFTRLEKLGLVSSQVHDLGGVRAAILLLSERGKQVAQGCGFTLVPSEWELLLQAHGGERQTKHAALCCAFAYQARKRGWGVELCPNVEGAAQPDMRIHQGTESLYVEVEAESGETERRMRKWRNQADLQGYIALCANNGGVRERLVLEARAASKHGVATDLQTLIKGQDEGAGLWVERWGKGTISG